MTATLDLTAGGLVRDLDEATYHAHHSLSSTGAKTLLKSPARYLYEREHPKVSDAFDLGSVVHGMVLGTGWPVVVVPDDLLASNGAASTKAAKDFIAAAREAGRIPMLSKEHAEARAMADAVLRLPVARVLFESATGESETSAFWTDTDTGVDCRARFDRIARTRSRTLLVDLKTCQDANPSTFGTTAAKFGYHLQAWWYRDGYQRVVDDPETPVFLHVLVEKSAPYLASVVQLDEAALALGGTQAMRARRLFRQYTDAAEWPGYSAEIQPVTLPRWAYQDEEFAR